MIIRMLLVGVGQYQFHTWRLLSNSSMTVTVSITVKLNLNLIFFSFCTFDFVFFNCNNYKYFVSVCTT